MAASVAITWTVCKTIRLQRQVSGIRSANDVTMHTAPASTWEQKSCAGHEVLASQYPDVPWLKSSSVPSAEGNGQYVSAALSQPHSS